MATEEAERLAAEQAEEAKRLAAQQAERDRVEQEAERQRWEEQERRRQEEEKKRGEDERLRGEEERRRQVGSLITGGLVTQVRSVTGGVADFVRVTGRWCQFECEQGGGQVGDLFNDEFKDSLVVSELVSCVFRSLGCCGQLRGLSTGR
jgi:hypothetical protein